MPGLTTPVTRPGLGGPGEIPIADPIGLDPARAPTRSSAAIRRSASARPRSSGSGGLLGDLSSAAQTLGAGQAIDLLKGMVMPAITGAIQQACRSTRRLPRAAAAAAASRLTRPATETAPQKPSPALRCRCGLER